MAVVELTSGVDLTQYLRVQERIQETGVAIEGRVLQICYGDRTNLEIVTVYETRDVYNKFTTSVLAPILEELNYTDVGYQSSIMDVHNVVVFYPPAGI